MWIILNISCSLSQYVLHTPRQRMRESQLSWINIHGCTRINIQKTSYQYVWCMSVPKWIVRIPLTSCLRADSTAPSNRVKWQYDDVIMGAIASEITSLTIVYSTVYSGADQRKHQSSASLAFVRGIHRGPVNSPHKWPVTRKMFPFDDVIMTCMNLVNQYLSHNQIRMRDYMSIVKQLIYGRRQI